jgi:hypothetical protein
MATQEEIEKRRIAFATLMTHGAHLAQAVQLISDQYGASKRALYTDWEQRTQWGIDYTPDESNVVEDLLAEIKEIERRLWLIADAREPFTHAGVKDRLKALTALRDGKYSALSALQSLGMVNREPIRINLEHQADEINQRVEQLCGDDQRLKDAVYAILFSVSQPSEN